MSIRKKLMCFLYRSDYSKQINVFTIVVTIRKKLICVFTIEVTIRKKIICFYFSSDYSKETNERQKVLSLIQTKIKLIITIHKN